MSKIHIRVMSDEALAHFKKNIKKITKRIMDNDTNSWINDEFDDYINDREKIKKDLNIRADRQVAYYLSALMYFQYLNRKKEVLIRIKELNGDAEKIKLDIFQQLKARRQFNELYFQCKYNNKISIAACKKIVSQGTKRLLSDTTLDRRASTIRSWIEWMLQYAAKHNLE